MNGKGNGPSKGAIMYPADEIEKAYRALEGSPAPLGHPVVNGKFVLARSPEGLARSYVGAHNENVRRENGRVLLDKVIDVQVANQSQGGRDLLAAIDKQEPIHTSTGVMAMLEKAGDGLPHNFVARNLLLEHDAILLNEAGAAGPEQGVGIFVNAAGDEIEVINSALDEEIDRDLDWSIDSMLRAVERKERQPLIERIKSFITELVQGGPTPETITGNALNKDEAPMDKAQYDALLAKVETIANAAPGITEEKVGEIVANALKPVTDFMEAQTKAAKDKEEAEHAVLVNQAVEAGVLAEDVAKVTPAVALTALLEKAKSPAPAFRVNAAFKGKGAESNDRSALAPKGD
ncbi:hypothetical protein [Sphingobium sp. WCS2017Hpa-17]|uniref:hypothetical protein n=1 Tax=Sphingobium sp. WCS2017Hpa-17 TaxID=3073638 RepID=UPI0028895147|nr:hypothetical protein [Sphingobium sp. WCS2017Hpa-17]